MSNVQSTTEVSAPAAGSIVIQRTRIIGTTLVTYGAYVIGADYGDTLRSFHTITHLDGAAAGRMGTESLPDELEALPARSLDRYTRVVAWQNACYDRAYALIEAAYPHLVGANRSMGQIDAVED